VEIVPFSKNYDRTSFDCENHSLNSYLKRTLSQDSKRSLSAAFLLINDNNQVVGYYTLSSHSIILADIPEIFRKGLPYPEIPTTLIGRLAVDKTLQGKGLGKRILIDALKRAWDNKSIIASWAVTVQAIDIQAEQFYQKLGFITYEERKLFYTMKNIGKLW